MIQPEELKKNEPLRWSAGTGTEVWELFCACTAGDLATVQRLVAKDPSLVRCHYQYRKPLTFAVRANQLTVAAFLLERDPDPTGLEWGDPLVQIARDRGYAEWSSCSRRGSRADTTPRRKASRSPSRSASAVSPESAASSTPPLNSCTPATSRVINRSEATRHRWRC